MKKKILKEFNYPTSLPESIVQAQQWQKANYEWWQNHPMRYDWKEQLPYKESSKEFYLEIDKRVPPCSLLLINSLSLKNKDVLEVGVGAGSHAGLLSKNTKSFTGIDLTDYSVESTRKRMKVFGLNGEVLKMDAERMSFDDNSFDLVWAWGVIHHSANTAKVLKEIQRILRPGGRVITMVYHRGWWNYYTMEVIWGLLSGNLLRTGSLHESAQLHSDGAMARFYTIQEWKSLTGKLFNVNRIYVLGMKSDIVPLPGGRIKNSVLKLIPSVFGRYLTQYLRMGSFLISELEKNK